MKTTMTLLRAGIALLYAAESLLASAPVKPAPLIVQIYLVDRSGSIGEFNPPETMQPALLHCVNLAELSQQPVSIAVIFFGAGGVHVVGDEHGMPTAAYATLRHELTTKWPKPEGETPMDAAFATALKMVHALPRDSQVTVVLMSDGEPSSGRLRPEDFPEIATEMKHRREAIIKKYQGFPPEIVQHCVRDLEQAWATPCTEEFTQLYRKQIQAEFQRTLEHATALAKEKVRFVTVDFAGGIPALRDIHQTAGGTTEDLVLTKPSAVIGKLHALGLTKLPRVVVPPPQSHDAQPNSFQSATDVILDPIASAAVITVEFRPAIVDFANNVSLVATVEGKELRFSPQSDDLQCQLAIDGKGNIATATLILDAIPKDGRVTIRFESPRGSLHVPASTVYTYLRLSEGTTIDFRPSFTPPEALPPYAVSSNHRAVWTCALRTKGDPKPYQLRGVEAVLCHTRTRTASRLEMKADPQSPGVFASEEMALPMGCYDAELHLLFPSGAKFSVTLPRHIDSVIRDEAITLEVCQPGASLQNPAGNLIGHIDFGPLGDKATSKTVIIVLRTLETDYPVTVAPSTLIADAQGTSPHQPWITFDKPQVTLQPGRAEKLRAVLTLPKQIEEAIQDGPFEGKLSLVRPDLQQPIPLKRYTKICGVDENEPVERVTFTLARPNMTIMAYHACRNRIKLTSDHKITLPIHISIGQPFQRTVTIEVTHDSLLPRDVTALPAAIFTDADGREVPAVRLVPVTDMPLTQQIVPGESGRWVLHFAVDNDCPTDKVFGTLDLSAPGMNTQHVSVFVERRNPLLAATIRVACGILAALCAIVAIQAIVRRFRARDFRTGQTHILTPKRPLKGALAVAAARNGTIQLTSEETMKVSRHGEPKPKLCAPQRPVSIDPSEVTPSRPLRLELCSPDGKPSQSFEITECLATDDGSPEVHLEVASGEGADQQRAQHSRRVRSMLAVAAASGLLAMTIGYPIVITSAQWLFDFFTFS